MPVRIIILLLLSALTFSASGAPSSTNSLAQQEVRQAQIRASTERLAAQVAAVVEEFRLNDIGGQDVQRLELIRRVLLSLSAEDMQAILEALRSAGEAPNPAASLNQTLAAYSRQRAVSAKMKAVIDEYLRLAEAYELAQRFREFAQRETALMWRTVALAKETAGKAADAFSETQQGELRLLQIDQEPIKEELAPLVSKLEQVRAEPVTDAPTARSRPQAARYAKESSLIPALDAATQGLQNGKLHSAAGDQRTARNHLRETARLLVLSHGRAGALRQAISDVDQTIDAERQLIAETEKAESRAPKLEPRQAEIADMADLVRVDVDSLVPAAAEDLKRAVQIMNEAREALDGVGRARRERAAPRQAKSIAAMEQARRGLQDELERANREEDKAPESLGELREVLRQVRQLIVDQVRLKEATAALDAQTEKPEDVSTRRAGLIGKAPAQGELKERAQSLQQRAAPACSAGAQSLGEAAAQMHKAQTSLAAAQNNPMAQQAAIEALKRAEHQLESEMNGLEQARQELDRLTQLLRRLVVIIENQQRLQFATARSTAGAGALSFGRLSQEQSALGAQTEQLRNDSVAASASAASHLGSARTHMDQASRDLGPGLGSVRQGIPDPVVSSTNAIARQTDALKELYAARDLLEKQTAALQEKIGPGTNSISAADAAAQMTEAQQRLEKALAALQAPPPGLLESLLRQQRQVVDGLNRLIPREQPPMPLRNAHASAAQAAQMLGQWNLAGAVGSMQRTRASMQQAIESGQTMDGNVDDLARQQAQVQQLAENLLAMQSAVPPAALAQAGQLLAETGEMIAPLASGQSGQLPGPTQASLQSAQSALANGAAQAMAGQSPGAQANAAAAAEALADAQSALALAQAGLNASPGQQGQVPGQGQSTGDGQNSSQPNAPSSPNANGSGRTGNWTGTGGAEGPRRQTGGQSRFTGLPPRERAALLQSQAEKYPQEYGPLIEQYLKNLSDQPAPK